MNNRKPPMYFEDDDLYYLKGMSTRPEPKPMLKNHLLKIGFILLCSFFGVAGLIILIGKLFA